MGEMDDITMQLADQWDRLSNAIDQVVTALPSQMTAASALLEAERRTMRALLNTWMIQSARKTPPPRSEG